MKRALISGVTGQDGSYLAELLLEKGYEVHGIIRRSSSFNSGRIIHIFQDLHETNPKFILHYGDLADGSRLEKLIEIVDPQEVYNLGAQSNVRISFDEPVYTSDIDAMGTLRFLEAIRNIGGIQSIRFYQASSSEMFGKVHETPQRETTPFHPRSPYACAKVFAHYQVLNYREAYGIHASSGILFNHEGPKRGLEFVTRKVTNAVARIKLELQDSITLGNLDASRDWGYAGDYVEAMWMMLQQDAPDDYVIATGETHTIRELLENAFALAGISDWEAFVKQDPRFYRPAEVDLLFGDASKAREVLGWKPRVGFPELVRMMYENDLTTERLKAGR